MTWTVYSHGLRYFRETFADEASARKAAEELRAGGWSAYVYPTPQAKHG